MAAGRAGEGILGDTGQVLVTVFDEVEVDGEGVARALGLVGDDVGFKINLIRPIALILNLHQLIKVILINQVKFIKEPLSLAAHLRSTIITKVPLIDLKAFFDFVT